MKLNALNLNARFDGGAALRWLRDGLLAWLPAGFRRWLADSSQRLIVAVDDREWALLREESGQTRLLQRLDAVALDWNAVTAWFKTGRSRHIVLRVSAAHALTRVLTLPLAAEKNLRQVVGFDMDRLTPFSANQVYYDVTVLERQPEQRRLRVKLTTLPRAAADPALTPLRQRGLLPDVLDLADSRPGLNLLPPEQRPRRNGWSRRLRTAAMLISLLLVAVAIVLPIWQQHQQVREVLSQIAQIRPAANEALTLRDQLDQVMAAAQLLAQKKQAVPSMLELLQELTAILPDDTWVERLQINGDNAQLIGQSAKASALIGIIEASKLFHSAGFQSPVNSDPRSGKERFVLGAKIGREP